MFNLETNFIMPVDGDMHREYFYDVLYHGIKM